MINPSYVRRITEDILHRKNKLTEHKLMHPGREWAIGLSLSTTILISGIFGVWYVHEHYKNSTTVEGATPPTTTAVYRETETQQALELWRKRAITHKAIKDTLQGVKPSNSSNQTNVPVISPSEPEPSEDTSPLTQPETTVTHPPTNERPPVDLAI